MSTASTQIHQNVVPSEVGWQFVPQYYTFVNKQPNRLHCFYTKTSTFIHGTEGEDIKPCFGQQEIHNKITSIGFQDCKVYIHSVDAQSSANGGIIIQVIGEMSNHGDPWRKFVQTFFLAEQPNGYFVLNDIFRFLKEEAVEDDASEPDSVAASEPVPVQAVPEPVVEPPPAPPREPTPPPPVLVAEEEPTTVIPEPASPPPAVEPKLQQVNGVHHEEPEPELAAPEPSVEDSPAPSTTPSLPEPAAPAPIPAAQVATPPPAASPAPPPPVQQQSQPAPPPQPAAPKTWANLAAANSKKWGAQVATESKGTSEVPVTSSSPAPPSGSQSPAPHGPPRGQAHHGPRDPSAIAAAQNVTTPQCFVKGVVEVVSQQQLIQLLTQRFGAVKEAEIVRSKACAFLEFTTLEAAKKAIVASLPQNQGGEGGIRVDVGGEVGQVRIVVETRKERGDRPPTRPRGGAPMNGEARGGFRGGRGGPGGRGRGAPPPAK
ncbi:hypothetical protein BJ138DRAFT_1084115 [Hygrophoropsis aurantiaca]|uniref:Uncharacterized protein n=1 Tax=Hygrophoropsis aurantiaca TaxID=72124 RepID=A0ACB8AG00_9AGAM|nr:hypothetical protein BJ138DRAFT_1084115 [Hygrophoropsis aurantiaca]